MADEADKAAEYEQDTIAHAIANRQRQPERTPLGYCQNPLCCDEFPAGDNRLFCDGKCASEAGRIEQQRRG